MKYVKLFEAFISEGGWATVKTQDTIIKPYIIKQTVDYMNILSRGFNAHLKSLDMPELKIGKPIGSGTWWKEDLKDQPNKEYGDVDLLVAYPTIETYDDDRKNEIETVKLYNSELIKWLEDTKPDYVDIEETKGMSTGSSIKLLLILDDESGDKAYVQIDMVVTHYEFEDWTYFRFTPMRNVKGFVIGSIYSAFGNALDLSIGNRGVRVKFVKDIVVPYRLRKDTKEVMITSDPKTFMTDIAKFFWNLSNPNEVFKPSKRLESWKGMDVNNPKIEDLIVGIKAVAETLEQLGEFGGSIKYANTSQFLDAVNKEYETKMMVAYNSSKFNKAKSDKAIEMRDKIRGLITKYIAVSKKLLK